MSEQKGEMDGKQHSMGMWEATPTSPCIFMKDKPAS